MKGKIDWKKILTAVVVIAIVYLALTGKLGALTGSDPTAPAESAPSFRWTVKEVISVELFTFMAVV